MFNGREGNRMSNVNSESDISPAESENLSMRRHSMFENRETSEVPAVRCAAGRSEKTCGRNSDVHASEESDIGVVPKKEPNKMVRFPDHCGGFGGKADDQGEILESRLRPVHRDGRKH